MKRFDSKVVDLNEFKAARAARQLDLLGPGEVEGLTAESGAPPEGPVEDRTLSGRDLAHRARMLAHLEAVRR
jgi:hypothetical protein